MLSGSLTTIHINQLPLDTISIQLIKETKAVPLRLSENRLILAMNDLKDTNTIERFQFKTGYPVKPIQYDSHTMEELTHQFLTQYALASLDPIKKVDHHQNLEDEPVTRFVNQLIEDALKQSASDIHLESFEHDYRIRFRIDGLLQKAHILSRNLSSRIISRLKIMAGCDIAEKRFPQDGRIKQGDIDIRLSTCPTLFGEKVVLRLLNQTAHCRTIDELGFLPEQKQQFLKAITKPQGLILVTGPTGSGKTNTLYAALSYLNQIEKNIVTIENPVEIILPGINQVNIFEKIGLTFAKALKTLLRQDPDIIMIGEIRDQETAQIAVHAAQTGHLVLSTLHTNSAMEAISRLENLGVSRYDIAHSIHLITAQRLLRRKTQNGFKGRIAVHELLEINHSVQDQIIDNQMTQPTPPFISMEESAEYLLGQNLTTSEEIKRVIGEDQR